MAEHNRIYLINRDLQIVSYAIDLSLIDYKAAITKKDFAAAQLAFARVPQSLYTRAARFLEHQGFLSEALELTLDADHKLELALQLDRLPLACEIVEKSSRSGLDLSSKWKLVGDKALEAGNVDLAKSCFSFAKDATSLFLIGASVGDAEALKNAVSFATDAQSNVALWSSLILGDMEGCLSLLSRSGRYAEACLFARTYCPDKLNAHFQSWKEELGKVSKSLANALTEPKEIYIAKHTKRLAEHETKVSVPATEQLNPDYSHQSELPE
jgi:coatomer subunit beta'